MPRLPRSRLVAENSTNHCYWRAHNHSLVLATDEARARFLALLAKYKAVHGIEILAYCLMGTHPHVVCRSPRGQEAFSAFWKVVNQCFARWSNRQTGRCGQVVMERLGSPRVQPGGPHELAVLCYGDMNPVRAGIARRPRDWPWSSHRHYALGEPNPLITDSPAYLALGRTWLGRRLAYLRLFAPRRVAPYRARRPDLRGPAFIGDLSWCRSQGGGAVARGPAPPGGAARFPASSPLDVDLRHGQ
jgi:putative transposase